MNFFSSEFIEKILKQDESFFQPKEYPPRLFEVMEILQEFQIKTRPIPPFCIIMANEEMSQIDIGSMSTNLENNINRIIQTHDHLILDGHINVVKKSREIFSDGNEARKKYAQISQNKHTVFFISDEGIRVFVNGFDIGDRVLFYTGGDLNKFIRKKDISELRDVLSEYKVALRTPTRYQKFFVPRGLLKQLYGEEYFNYKNLLINKPENLFRDDLKQYLQDKIDRTFNFNREVPLDTNQRLDINTEDNDGNYYFLEIKWIGKSINPDYDDEGTSYSENDIEKDGIRQTLQYIEELHAENKLVKLGWLTVFDARPEKVKLDFDNYDHLEEELKKNLHLFDVISDLAVDNINPR